MNKNKGFTLIELLVVIAIIGILSSVVLASLNTARNKGKDASAKSSLSSIRAQAEIFYNGAALSYGTAGAGTVTSGVSAGPLSGACADAQTVTLLNAVSSQVGTNPVYCTIGQNGATYEADVVLNDTTIFCVDSSGFAGTVTSAPGRITTGPVACK